MGQEYLIDTNTAIDYLDDKLPNNANLLIERISSKISVITQMELTLCEPGAVTKTKPLSLKRSSMVLLCIL